MEVFYNAFLFIKKMLLGVIISLSISYTSKDEETKMFLKLFWGVCFNAFVFQ